MRSLKRPSLTPLTRYRLGVSAGPTEAFQGQPSRFIEASLALAPCPPGQTVITEAFDLAPVRWLTYPVGPIYPAPRLAWLVQQPLQLEGVAGAAAPSKAARSQCLTRTGDKQQGHVEVPWPQRPLLVAACPVDAAGLELCEAQITTLCSRPR